MSNLDNDSKKMLIGALIGGAIGVGATIFLATRHKEKGNTGSTLNLIQEALGQVSEILENNNFDKSACAIKETGKKIHKNEDTISEVVNLVSLLFIYGIKFKNEEFCMFNPKHNFKDFLAGAILGGTLGAMTAMAMRTPKGKKLQKEMMEKFKLLGDKADFLKDNIKMAIKKNKGTVVRKVGKKRRALKKAVRRRTS